MSLSKTLSFFIPLSLVLFPSPLSHTIFLKKSISCSFFEKIEGPKIIKEKVLLDLGLLQH
jgi:hypothetical protein